MSFSPQSPCQGNAGTPLKQPKEQTASGNTSSHSSETNSLKTNTIQSTCASPEIDPAGKISAAKEKQSEHQHILQKNPDSHNSTALQTKPSFTLENVKRGFFYYFQSTEFKEAQTLSQQWPHVEVLSLSVASMGYPKQTI